MFLARRCPICKEISDAPCDACVAKLEPADFLECAPEFELGCRALFAYTEVSSRLVLTLKYQRDTHLVRWLAPQLAGLVAGVLRAEIGARTMKTKTRLAHDARETVSRQKTKTGLEPTSQLLLQKAETFCVTWIPASAKNRRKRGYDQAEMLAKAVAREIGLPCRKLLKRNRDLAQGDRDFKGRLQGPTLAPVGSFHAGNCAASNSPANSKSRSPNTPQSVLIVDDVVTTGSSLRRAAETLRQAGVPRIGAIAVASRAKIPSHT